MKKSKNITLVALLAALALSLGCGDNTKTPVTTGGNVDALERIDLDKMVVGELKFEDPTEATLKTAAKTDLAVSGDYIYIGTDGAGLWSKRKDGTKFELVADTDQYGVNATAVSEGDLDPINAADKVTVDAILPFNGGIAVEIGNGIAIVKDGVTQATYSKDAGGWANEDLTDFLITKDNRLFLATAGSVMSRGLADRTALDADWDLSTDADDAAISNVNKFAMIGGKLYGFNLNDADYLVWDSAELKAAGKPMQKVGERVELDLTEFNIEGAANDQDALKSVYWNGDHGFITLDGTAVDKKGGIGIWDGDANFTKPPKEGIGSESGFYADGDRTLIYTDMGYYLANGSELGDFIDVKYSEDNKFVADKDAGIADQKSGFDNKLPGHDFTAGALDGDMIYLIEKSDDTKVLTVSMAKETVELKKNK